MTATTETRKRSREEDSNDFMPLSKRINNLHLTNNNTSQNYDNNFMNNNQMQFSHSNENVMQNENNIINNSNGMGYINAINNSHLNLVTPNNHHASTSSQQQQQQQHIHHQQQQIVQQQAVLGLGSYNPELSQKENPHYFNKNKMLYDLYVERIRRCPNSN